MEKITDNMKYIVSEGDVVTIHDASWDYSKRIGEPFEAKDMEQIADKRLEVIEMWNRRF